MTIEEKAAKLIARDGSAEEVLFYMLLEANRFRRPLDGDIERRPYSVKRLNKEEKELVRYIIDTHIEKLAQDLDDPSDVVTPTITYKVFFKQILKYASDESKVYLTMKLGR